MPETPVRPYATREIIRAAAEELAAKMGCDEDDLADHYYHCMDGYEFARELETHAGWTADRSMADDLDEMEHLVDERLAIAEKQWFAENNIQPPLPIGARMLCPVRQRVGVIDEIYQYGPARYLVRPEDPDDQERARKGRWIIKFEDAQPA